jgi:hypothetical protein
VLAIWAGQMSNPSEKDMVLDEMDNLYVLSLATQLSNQNSCVQHFHVTLRHVRHGGLSAFSTPRDSFSSPAWKMRAVSS